MGLALPDFEIQVMQNLEAKFEKTFKQLFEHYMVPANSVSIEQHLRPLTVRLGQLRSSMREGLVKFYSKNAFEMTECMNPQSRNFPTYIMKDMAAGSSYIEVFFEVMKKPQSFCLRERMARECEILKSYIL